MRLLAARIVVESDHALVLAGEEAEAVGGGLDDDAGGEHAGVERELCAALHCDDGLAVRPVARALDGGHGEGGGEADGGERDVGRAEGVPAGVLRAPGA